MNEKHLQTIRGAIGEKFYWNFYCDFFSMASSKGLNKEHFLDEKRWLKYVETAAVAIDLMIVADQTKENRAAHEFHLIAVNIADNAMSYGNESTEIHNFVNGLEDKFNSQYVAFWSLPSHGEKNEYPEVMNCGVQLLLREKYVKLWKKFRTEEFSQKHPFNLDVETAKKILQSILKIDKTVQKMGKEIYQEIVGGRICVEVKKRWFREGLEMFHAEGATIDEYIGEIPEALKIYQEEEQSEEMKRDIEKMKDVSEVLDVALCHASTGLLYYKQDFYEKVFGNLGKSYADLVSYLSGKTEGAMSLFRFTKEEFHPLFAESFSEFNLYTNLEGKPPSGAKSEVEHHPYFQKRVMRGLSYGTIAFTAKTVRPGSNSESKNPYFYLVSFLGYFYSFVVNRGLYCKTLDWLKRFNASGNKKAFLKKEEGKEQMGHYHSVFEWVYKNPEKITLSGVVPKRVKDASKDEEDDRAIFLKRASIRMQSCEEFKYKEKESITAQEEEEFGNFVNEFQEVRIREWKKLEEETCCHVAADDDLVCVLSQFLG